VKNRSTRYFHRLPAVFTPRSGEAGFPAKPAAWCSVPKGQTQPQKARPNSSVTGRKTSARKSAAGTLCAEMSEVARTSRSASRNTFTG